MGVGQFASTGCMTILYIVIGISLPLLDATHFRGGLVTLRTIGSINRASNVTLEITQRYGWRRDYSMQTFCDDSTITNNALAGETGSLASLVNLDARLPVLVLCRYIAQITVDYCSSVRPCTRSLVLQLLLDQHSGGRS